MISFTKEERTVLVFFVLVLAAGTGLNYALKIFPQINHAVLFIENNRPARKVNVNTASYDELLGVRAIGPYTATKILELRAQEGPLLSLDRIQSIGGISRKNFEIFSQYLTVR
jgi:predicted DNA-binding helix-hairpin-helix protein